MEGTYLWKPLPSILTTIHVLGRSVSSRSKERTYSYLPHIVRELLDHWSVGDRTWSSPSFPEVLVVGNEVENEGIIVDVGWSRDNS